MMNTRPPRGPGRGPFGPFRGRTGGSGKLRPPTVPRSGASIHTICGAPTPLVPRAPVRVELRAPGAPTAYVRGERFVTGTASLARRFLADRPPPPEESAPQRAERPPLPGRQESRARLATQRRNDLALAEKLPLAELIAPLSTKSDRRRCIYASAIRKMDPVIRYAVPETQPDARDFALELARLTNTDPVTIEITLFPDRDPALAFAHLIDKIRFRSWFRQKIDRFAACYPPLGALQRLATECTGELAGLGTYCADLVDRISDAWVTVEVIIKAVEHCTQLLEKRLAVPPVWQELLVDWHLNAAQVRKGLVRAVCRRYRLAGAPWSQDFEKTMVRHPLRIVIKRPAAHSSGTASESIEDIAERLSQLGFFVDA